MASGAAESMYLVDAHSLIFQVFHAIPEMSSPSGLPTNALFGFTRDMLFLRANKKPAYLVCAFDVSGPTFRDEIYPEYKAQRGPMPDDLVPQLPLIQQLLEAMHIPVLGVPGFEADDVLATVAREGEGQGLDVYLCTSDKDCRQLIRDRVKLYSLRKHKALDRQALLEDWGITPEQVVDFQTLVGDPVDNVKGVPGIGEKTAAKLLQEFGSLGNVLQNIDKVAGAKKQEALRAFLPRVELTRKLIRLDDHVPLTMDWEGWRLRPWDTEKLLALFREWGFRGFAEEVREASRGQEQGEPVAAPVDNPDTFQGDLFEFGFNVTSDVETPEDGKPVSSAWESKYELVNTSAKFERFLRALKKQKRFAFDLETTALDALRADLVGWAFCWKAGEAYYLPVRGPEGAMRLDPAETLNALRPLLENPKVAKVNQNIKYDLLALRHQGVSVAGVAGDSMVADYLLHAGERSHGLDELARRYFDHVNISITELIGKKGKGQPQLRMDQVAIDKVCTYAAEDADVAWRLCERLEPELEREGLKRLYDELEIPLIDVLADMEAAGIRLDIDRLRQLSTEMAAQLEIIEVEVHRLAGRPFNIGSPKQLREVLFNELKLPTQKKTGITGEASTDQETLERLAALGHDLPRKIVEHRQIAKLKGTYVDALPDLVDPATGRIHASFNQTVAATGRLSSSDPNLQNIPVRTEQGRQIRQAFLPAEGWTLVTADYSQIELRLLAHFCGDDELRRAFAEDRDIHAAVASQIYGVPEPDVTAQMRRAAKTVNFGVIYGISPHGLAQRLGVPRDEAARFIDAYFARYPRVQEYQGKLLEACRKTGQVGTILARRRAISGIRSNSTYQQRNQPEREAINMEIQGSAADLIKLAMLHVNLRLKREGLETRMLLQIHDELVFEAPPNELDAVVALVSEEMTTPLERELHLEVPLRVDVSAGPNWLDVEEVATSVAG